ncbi:MAG TPA: 3-isopropylmalate dehydratase small subunit [Thermodesulfobacteriaceae bacterium]|nr:3-isopropylmalate dehydratase small subunit [Thermodesulfobacteriaceae bacterium]
MKIKGRAWKFGENIDTDVIIPARYLNTSDPAELAKHCMEDADPDLAAKIAAGDVIVAGRNFGCGSSREHAPIALKAAGIGCVIAPTFARIFYRNAFNMGLPIFECSDIEDAVSQGDVLEIDGDTGEISNLTTGRRLKAQPIPAFMQELIADGGLIPHVLKKFEKSSSCGS